MTLERFAAEARGLSRSRFLKTYTHSVLIFGAGISSSHAVRRGKTRRSALLRPREVFEGASHVVPIKKSSWNPLTPVSVGRDPICDIVLNDPTVSKHHAVFILVPDDVKVLDQESMNGTWVNDEIIPLERAISLRDGNKVSFGQFSTARFYTPQGLWNVIQSFRAMVKSA